MWKVKVVRRISAIKIYDTIDRSAVKIHRRVFISCCRAKACNFSGLVNILFWNFPRKTIPVERATQQWRSIRKTTSCKKTPESPGCSSSLTGQKKIRSRQFKRFWNWFGKSKCPGSLLNLIVNFHHEHFIVPTSCPYLCMCSCFYITCHSLQGKLLGSFMGKQTMLKSFYSLQQLHKLQNHSPPPFFFVKTSFKYSGTSTDSHLSTTATSLQRPLNFVPADGPHTDGYLNLSKTANSPQRQRPLKRVPTCHNNLSTTASFFSD